MDSEIVAEPFPLLSFCTLCLNQGAVESLLAPIPNEKSGDNYASLLFKCFSIDVTSRKLGDVKILACSECIRKLVESAQFKTQVESSLKTLENAASKVHAEAMKIESNLDNDYFAGTFDADYEPNESASADLLDIKQEEDDIPLLKLRKEKLKGTKKDKTSKSCKKNNISDNNLQQTVNLIKRGLFPFKIRNNVFSCGACKERSTDLDTIRNHAKSHRAKVLHIAFDKMMINSQRFYKNEDKLSCKLCLADISTYEELKSHINNCERLNYNKSNWNLLPFTLEKDQKTCPMCKITFLNFVSLNTHMNEHYPNYICENCGKAFASKGRLRGHIRTHEIGEFPCRYCNAVFDKVTKRENHVSKDHKNGIRYSCKQCGISLPSFYARQKHLAEIHNEELKRYKCKACDQSYITPGHLSSHVRRDHLNERNHKCEKCDLAFYSKNALKMHMIKHGGERIHTCPVCQKSYQRKKTLREHLRIHNNDKRFVCPVCGRAFTQKCTLKGHLRVHEKITDGSVSDRLVHLNSI